MEGEVSVEHVSSEKNKLSPVRHYSDETFCSESSDGNHSNRSKNNILLQKRSKTSTAASGNPYRASASNFGARYVLLSTIAKNNTNSITQKVLSAKRLHLKQLQNELNNAQFQINELSTENRMLRTLQKRQDLALKRFEDKKADLPILLNAHTEEVRMLRATMKQLRAQVHELEVKMKDRDTELAKFRDKCSTLTDLCNNKQLEERYALQKRVEELSKRNEEQAERIKLLNRKVALESKNYDHRLKTETTNHRNTQRELTKVLEYAAELQAALEAKEKFIRSKIYPTSNHKRRSETGSGLVSGFSLASAGQSRFPELQKVDQLHDRVKGSKHFPDENSYFHSNSSRFSLGQEQAMSQSSDEKLNLLQIRGTKKLNLHSSSYSLKQQKYGRRHQDHQTIPEDPDSDSQHTMGSSGAELFEDEEEHEEHTVTADELSKESSLLHQQNSDQSKTLSDNAAEKPLTFLSNMHIQKSSSNSSVMSQTSENSLKNSSDSVMEASLCSTNVRDTRQTNFNNGYSSANTEYNGHSSEDHSMEETHCMGSSPTSETICRDEKATIPVEQSYSSVDVPKSIHKKSVMGEENTDKQLNQHPIMKEEKNHGTLRKGELLAALKAIDKGEDVHTDVAKEHTEVDLEKAKNKTNLMRELFGNS